MKVKYGQIIAEGRGKLGGLVGSRNTYGAYFRTKVTPTNPGTAAQIQSRQYMTNASQAWKGLTEAQRLLWNSTSLNYSRTDIFGDQANLTGFNLFMRLNKNLLEIGEAQITNAPQPVEVDGQTSISVVADTTAGTMNITFAPAITADSKVLLFATPALSAGKNFVKSELRKVKIMDVGDVSPFDAAADYIVKYGALPPVGSKIFVAMKAIDKATGNPGSYLKASDIAV